jgi:glycosyltransferase involved in cell wall biosynthesis
VTVESGDAAVARGLVDVIVPTNRLSPFLGPALESVRSQHYSPRRVLLVDDGSDVPDALDSLAADMPDTTIIHRAHEGVSAARNAAIRAGRGEFVTFLDDDDLWPPQRLEDLVATLREHPEAAGAFGNGRYIDAEGEVFGQWTTSSASREDFLRGATPIPRITALLVRRSALERVGLFDETLAYSEDDELILRLLRDAALVGTGTTVVDYRRHGENATLAHWRVRHRSARAAVGRNIAAAQRLGEHEQARLLRLNLKRVDRSTAAKSAGRVFHEIRARRVRSAVADLGWSIRIAPLGFLRGAVQSTTSHLRARIRSHAR